MKARCKDLQGLATRGYGTKYVTFSNVKNEYWSRGQPLRLIRTRPGSDYGQRPWLSWVVLCMWAAQLGEHLLCKQAEIAEVQRFSNSPR